MSFPQKPSPGPTDADHEPSDHDAFRRLLTKARRECGAALGELIESVRPQLLARARRNISRALAAKLDPADLVQETALDIHRSLRDFRGHTRGEFLAWASQILAHKAVSATRYYKLTRKREVRREVSLDGMSNLAIDAVARRPQPSAEPDEHWAARLEAAIARLPEQMRQAFALHYLELMSYGEIAAQMHCSAEAVRKRCSRAAARLRREFES